MVPLPGENLNVTVPVGLPPNCPVTVAVNLTDWLTEDELGKGVKATLEVALLTT
jgi:ABC-type uncharacterized transport system YnjBCD permease subunit